MPFATNLSQAKQQCENPLLFMQNSMQGYGSHYYGYTPSQCLHTKPVKPQVHSASASYCLVPPKESLHLSMSSFFLFHPVLKYLGANGALRKPSKDVPYLCPGMRGQAPGPFSYWTNLPNLGCDSRASDFKRSVYSHSTAALMCGQTHLYHLQQLLLRGRIELLPLVHQQFGTLCHVALLQRCPGFRVL